MKSIFLAFLVLLLSIQIFKAQWVNMSNGISNGYLNTITVSGINIFAGSSSQGVFLSTNNGESWNQTTLNNRDVYSLAVLSNSIFAGVSGTGMGVYVSTNNGAIWTQTSLNFAGVGSLLVTGNNVIAGTFLPSNGVYISTDNGTAWTQTSLNNRAVWALSLNGNTIFAGTDYGVYLSQNNGTNWTQTSLNNRTILSLAFNSNFVFAGTAYENGVYISANNGTNWIQTSLNNMQVNTLTLYGNTIFAGTSINGVYVSSDNGANWIQKNEGLGNLIVHILCISNNYIFAGTGNGIYRRLLNQIVGIKSTSNEIPNKFSLSQNYPNPFNPETKIVFNIPPVGSGRDRSVRLIVYDNLGREVRTLVNEELQPGKFEVTFDGSKLSSGIYYYKLEVRDASASPSTGFTETKRMVLVK
jgi:hypothetical protein